MTVPEGFTVELVASEPDIVNPVAMTFDERGRIWITESLEYPAQAAGPGRGPRQDPRRHRRRRQGGQVHDLRRRAEHPLRHRRRPRRRLGRQLARHPLLCRTPMATARPTASRRSSSPASAATTRTSCPTRFTWGPDGWLYGLNGVFNHSHVKYAEDNPNYKADHPGWKFTCALFRIHPGTREFEVFCEGTSNPWGVAFDDEGACVRQRLRDRPPLAPDRDRLLPPPGRALSAVHLEDREHRQAQAPEGGLLRHPLLRQRRLSRAVPRQALHGQHPRQLHQRRQARARRQHVLRHAASPTSSPPTTPGSCRSCRRPARTAACTSSTGTTAITAIRTPTATRTASTG